MSSIIYYTTILPTRHGLRIQQRTQPAPASTGGLRLFAGLGKECTTSMGMILVVVVEFC